MIEAIFEVICELILQAILEVAVELGLHAVSDPFRSPPNPWLSAIGYALFGAAIGGLSLWAFPNNFVHDQGWRIANLVVTPMAAGGLMCVAGSHRSRRGRPVLRIDRFAYGYLFALSLALVRFIFAT